MVLHKERIKKNEIVDRFYSAHFFIRISVYILAQGVLYVLWSLWLVDSLAAASTSGSSVTVIINDNVSIIQMSHCLQITLFLYPQNISTIEIFPSQQVKLST